MTISGSTVPLIDRLQSAGELWAEKCGTSLARLGRLVMNDNGFFSRIEASASTTTATLEKFARFLANAENWPGGEVPGDVRLFVHVVGITPESGAGGPGNCNQMSGGIDYAGNGTN